MKDEIYVEELTDLDRTVDIIRKFADSPFITFTDSDENIKSFAKKQLEYGHVLAVFDGADPLGYVCFYSNDHITKTAFVSAIVLGGTGLEKGKLFFKLIEKAIVMGINEGMTSLKIQVNKDNIHARRLYEKMGFEYTGEENELGLYMLITKQQLVEKLKIRVDR